MNTKTWDDMDITTLGLKNYGHYHPIERGLEVQVKTPVGWRTVVYFYIVDTVVAVWIEPLMGTRAVKIVKKFAKIKLRSRPVVKEEEHGHIE